MIPKLREVDFEFMKEISQKEKNLGKLRRNINLRMNSKIHLSTIQKILIKLENVKYVKSERRGRERFVKITNDGEYFLKFYLKQRRLKK